MILNYAYRLSDNNVFNDILHYLKYGTYKTNDISKDQKRSIRQKASRFTLKEDQLSMQGKVVVVDKEKKAQIVQAAHQGIGSSLEAAALSGHQGRDKTYSLIEDKYYWPSKSNKTFKI